MQHKPKTVVVDWINTIWETDLPYQSKYLACYLRKFMNSQHDMAYPSYARIIEETGLSRMTVSRYLEKLEEEGWLVRNRGHKGKNTEYTACFPSSITAVLVSERAPTSTTQSKTSTTQVHELNNNKQVINNILSDVPKKPSKYKYNPEHLAIASEMAIPVIQRFPTMNINLDEWSDAVRKLMEIDGHSNDQIMYLWRWRTDHQNNGFSWADNIRTPMKLRQKKEGLSYFDKLISQIKQDIGHAKNKSNQNATGHRPSAVERVHRRAAETHTGAANLSLEDMDTPLGDIR